MTAERMTDAEIDALPPLVTRLREAARWFGNEGGMGFEPDIAREYGEAATALVAAYAEIDRLQSERDEAETAVRQVREENRALREEISIIPDIDTEDVDDAAFRRGVRRVIERIEAAWWAGEAVSQ